MVARGDGGRSHQPRRRSPSRVDIDTGSNSTPKSRGVTSSPALGKNAKRGSTHRTAATRTTKIAVTDTATTTSARSTN
jgi:hypothetical protein